MAISPSLMRPYPGKAVGRTMQLDPVWILYPLYWLIADYHLVG